MLILLDITVSFKEAFDLQGVKMFIKVEVGGLCARPQSILSTIFFFRECVKCTWPEDFPVNSMS